MIPAEKLREAVAALPGYRDPRYSGVALIDRLAAPAVGGAALDVEP